MILFGGGVELNAEGIPNALNPLRLFTAPFEKGKKGDEPVPENPTESMSAPERHPSERTEGTGGGNPSPSIPPEAAETMESIPDLLPYKETLGYVNCQSDFPLGDMETFRTEIRDLQRDLIEYLGVPAPKEPVILCVFRERKDYVAFLKKNCPQAPLNRPALYIKDQGPGFVFLQFDEKMILNLRHEMTHAILNASLRNIPIWLDEGLAKYFETEGGKRGLENPFLTQIADRADSFFSPVPSLPHLERLTKVEEMGPAQYRDAWAWTHFLIHYSPQTQQLLGHYLQSLRPERQVGIDARKAAEIQRSAPMTTLLKSQVPDYKKKYRDHFIEWSKKQ